MNIKNYIASGILENYILGLATDAERQEVEKYAIEYPEIRAELEAIELAMEDYAQIHNIKAPDGIEAKINAKIDALENLPNDPKDSSSNNSSKPDHRSQWGSWLLGLMLLLVGILAWMNYQKAQQQTEQVNQLNNQLATLQNNCDETSRENAALKQRLQILQDPDNQPIKMSGTAPGTNLAPEAIAVIHLNEKNQTIYIDPQTLPVPPSNKQYELWAIIPGDPAPKSMGVFDVLPDSTAFQQMTYVAEGTTFAVTLEDRGRSGGGPTLEQMYVLGTI